jgi:hypothetical protein
VRPILLGGDQRLFFPQPQLLQTPTHRRFHHRHTQHRHQPLGRDPRRLRHLVTHDLIVDFKSDERAQE